MEFPIYKEYLDQKSYFQILSPDEFLELKITGKTFTLHRIKAKILPERVMIQDMLEKEEFWVTCTENEFAEKLEFCRRNLKELP